MPLIILGNGGRNRDNFPKINCHMKDEPLQGKISM